MRSKLSIVVRTRLRGVAGEGTGNGGVGYIFGGYRDVVVAVVVVLTVGLTVAGGGYVTTTDVVIMLELVVALTLCVCQPVVDVLVTEVDSVVNSSSN